MTKYYYQYNASALTDSQNSAIESFIKEFMYNSSSFERINCPICLCPNHEILFHNDRYGIPTKTVRCSNCSLVYQNPRLTKDSLNYFYSSNIYRDIYGRKTSYKHENFSKKFEFNDNYKLDLNNYSALESMFFFITQSKIQFETVCEVGAGGGWNLAQFNVLGKSTVGYEPNTILVEMGKNKGINLKQGFTDDLKGSYDLVILRHVLEHFLDPIDELKKIRKHNNKYLFIEVPGIIDKLPSIQNAHNFYFSLNTLNKTLALSGYKPKHTVYFRTNNFIMLIAEKDDGAVFNYNYFWEATSVKNIITRYKFRFAVSDLIIKMGLSKVKNKFKSYLRTN